MKIRLRIFNAVFTGFLLSVPVLTNAQTFEFQPTVSFATKLAVLTNADRTARNVSSITVNPLLSAAAQKKADDMAAKEYFSHYSPAGTSPWYWFSSVGYYYTHAGENLAINFDTPTALESAWMNSPAHRANIVRGLYTETGVGIAHGTYKGRPATFIVQLFATPAIKIHKVSTYSPLASKTL